MVARWNDANACIFIPCAVAGAVTALGPVALKGAFLAEGAANISGDLAVGGGATVGGDVAVAGSAQIGGQLEVAGVAQLLGGAQVGPQYELAADGAGGLAVRSRLNRTVVVLEAEAQGRTVGLAHQADTLTIGASTTNVSGALLVEGELTGVPIPPFHCVAMVPKLLAFFFLSFSLPMNGVIF